MEGYNLTRSRVDARRSWRARLGTEQCFTELGLEIGHGRLCSNAPPDRGGGLEGRSGAVVRQRGDEMLGVFGG